MKKLIGLSIGLLFFVSNAFALDFGIGVGAGSNGIGLNLSVGLTKTINLRLSAAEIDIDDEDETVTVGDDLEGDIDAELDFDYGATAVLFDWHAFDNGFRFTAGMMKNNGAADLDGTLQSSIIIDGQRIDTGGVDLVGDSIGGEVSLGDSYQPYIGIGWGRGAGGDGGFSFSADLGVAVLDPDVDFEASVVAGTNFIGPTAQDDLDAALRDLEKDAEDELDDYELWPVLAIGVNYAF